MDDSVVKKNENFSQTGDENVPIPSRRVSEGQSVAYGFGSLKLPIAVGAGRLQIIATKALYPRLNCAA